MPPRLGPAFKRVASNGATLAIGNWFEALLRLLTIVILTRQLGSVAYGIWAYALAVSGLAMGFVSLGFDRLVPIRVGADRTDIGRVAVETGALRVIAVAMGICGLVAYAHLAEPAGETRTAVLLALPYFVGRAFYAWARPIFVGLEKAPLIIGFTIISRSVEMVVLAMVLVLGADVFLVLGVIACLACVEAAVAAVLVRREVETWAWPKLSGLKVFLFSGLTLGLADLLAQWLMAGPLVLWRQFDPGMKTMGQVALALQVSTLIVATIRPFMMAALPALGRAHRRQDVRLGKVGSLVAIGTVVLLLPGALLAWIIGPYLIPMIFGQDFELAGRLLAPAVLIAMAALLSLGYESLLVVEGRRFAVVLAGAVGAVALIVASEPLVGSWSTAGILVAAMLAWGARAAFIILAGIRSKRHPLA